MGLVKLVVCLSMLMTLTSTWASSSTERQEKMIIEKEMKQGENGLKRYMKNKADNEIIIAKSIDEKSMENDENHLRKLMKIEAEKLLQNRMKNGGKLRRSLDGNDDKTGVPFSTRRFKKMLEKAIFKIITGDLSTADMLLLKSLNYSLEDVMAIREREFAKKIKQPEVSEINEKNKIFYDQKSINDLNEPEESLTESSLDNHSKNHEEKSSMIKKKKKSVTPMSSGSSSDMKIIERHDKDFDFDAYNRQAVYDYENGPDNKMPQQSELNPITSSVDYENHSNDNKNARVDDDDLRTNFDRAMESHVVFKIRYDDSEFDSGSDEKIKQFSKERTDSAIPKNDNFDFHDERKIKNITDDPISTGNEFSASSGINKTSGNNEIKPFQESTVNNLSSLPVVYRLGNFVTSQKNLNVKKSDERSVDIIEKNNIIEEKNGSLESLEIEKNSGFSMNESDQLEKDNGHIDSSIGNETDDRLRKNNVYEGLEWVEDDVYRVIPEAIESLNYYDGNANEMDDEMIDNIDINETRTHDIDRGINEIDNNDTIGYQNENSENENNSQSNGGNSSMRNSPNVNLSTYQQLALAHRRDGNFTSPFDSQGQKAIEDIKLKILAMTGRFNLSSSGNQVQRERLTMFSPICQEPRNTDSEAWSDQFLMNMYFQLNLTSGDHVVAAKLRIFKLPQDNMTVTSGGVAEEEDEEEKKIRISIYFYTKSLKKHRSKKRLMDSVVIALTTEGTHLALDVRQALRFWRQNLRNAHGTNNHGLVIQVEDQEGRPLKPSQYIQQDSCHTSEMNEDDKAYQRVPALFIQACSRYVRVVNGEVVTYVNCSKSSRNGRH